MTTKTKPTMDQRRASRQAFSTAVAEGTKYGVITLSTNWGAREWLLRADIYNVGETIPVSILRLVNRFAFGRVTLRLQHGNLSVIF